jgi:hypothetical protein
MTSERLDLGQIAAMTGFALSLIPQGFPTLEFPHRFRDRLSFVRCKDLSANRSVNMIRQQTGKRLPARQSGHTRRQRGSTKVRSAVCCASSQRSACGRHNQNNRTDGAMG